MSTFAKKEKQSPKMKKFTDETMLEIMVWLEEVLTQIQLNGTITFRIPDPDGESGRDSGIQSADPEKTSQLYHGWKSWVNLAELLCCRILTPQRAKEGDIRMRFQKLDKTDSFHQAVLPDKREKYGTDSEFSAIRKNEEPTFLYAYKRALHQVKIEERKTILDLGINRGDEFDLIRKLVDGKSWREMKLIGIDHSLSAIREAEKNFPEKSVTFHCHDINRMDELTLPKADLIISIGTLQSPELNFKTLFMSLIQNYLEKEGAVILGFPNCRWIDGEMIYGAKAPNYPFSEMSLVVKDIYFCKKYLQQHRFRVTITGREYLFLTATKIKK